MYITDLFYFVKDCFNKDKKIRVINKGNNIIFRVLDRKDYEAMEKEKGVEEQEINKKREQELEKKAQREKEAKARKQAIAKQQAQKPVQREEKKSNEELKGFARLQRERATQVLNPEDINNSTRYMSDDEKLKEFIRRMENSKKENSVKTKKITK